MTELTNNTNMNPMDCTDIKIVLSGLIDDEISLETRYAAERHLAQCAGCRAVIDEAEGLNDLLMLSAEREMSRGMPGDLIEEVLARTMYQHSPAPYFGRWTTWTGWIAAAASLGLALTIWVMDRQNMMQPSSPEPIDSNAIASLDYQAGSEMQSATFEGDPSLDVYEAPSKATTVSYRPVLANNSVYPDVVRAESMVFAPGAGVAAASPDAIADRSAITQQKAQIEKLVAQPTISEKDAATLDAAAILLELLAEADLSSFEDIEWVRRVAEYDEILPRLSEARARLDPADRPAVLAAESILLRVVRGPINMQDLQLLRDTVSDLNVSKQVAALSRRQQPKPSTM